MKSSTISKPSYDAYEPPVLIIAFNRPQYVQKQLQALNLVRPKHIFLACDGPRITHSEDIEKVKAVKEAYQQGIDWPCDLRINFSAINRGCSNGPIHAMTWFFSEVSEGIILEDDIVPNKDFFDFMCIMLKHYRDNKGVMSISGCTLGYRANSNKVYASKIMNMWGWATWADRFNKVDFKLKDWKQKPNKNWYLHHCLNLSLLDYDKRWINHWKEIFNKTVSTENITWWDFQFIYNQLALKKITIFPPRNLVENIGFDTDATHTHEKEHFSKYLKPEKLDWPLLVDKKPNLDQTFYSRYIKEVWSFYKRPNWKFYLGNILKKINLAR